MSTRRAARIDPNHREIRQALRDAGYTVFDTHTMGDGYPDLVVVTRSGRAAILVEIKPEQGGKVKPAEARFMIQLVQPAYRVVTSVDQAIEIMRSINENP